APVLQLSSPSCPPSARDDLSDRVADRESTDETSNRPLTDDLRRCLEGIVDRLASLRESFSRRVRIQVVQNAGLLRFTRNVCHVQPSRAMRTKERRHPVAAKLGVRQVARHHASRGSRELRMVVRVLVASGRTSRLPAGTRSTWTSSRVTGTEMSLRSVRTSLRTRTWPASVVVFCGHGR